MSMVAGQPAPPHVDSYHLLDTVSLLRCDWGGTEQRRLRGGSASHADRLK